MSYMKDAFQKHLDSLPEADYQREYYSEIVQPDYSEEELEDMANWFNNTITWR